MAYRPLCEVQSADISNASGNIIRTNDRVTILFMIILFAITFIYTFILVTFCHVGSCFSASLLRHSRRLYRSVAGSNLGLNMYPLQFSLTLLSSGCCKSGSRLNKSVLLSVLRDTHGIT